MKRNTIITAMILDHYAELIEQDIKRLRGALGVPQGGRRHLPLISSETGTALGTYEVVGTLCFSRDKDDEVMGLAQTTPKQFYRLFPAPSDGSPERLWAAELGSHVSLDSLLGIGAGN